MSIRVLVELPVYTIVAPMWVPKPYIHVVVEVVVLIVVAVLLILVSSRSNSIPWCVPKAYIAPFQQSHKRKLSLQVSTIQLLNFILLYQSGNNEY